MKIDSSKFLQELPEKAKKNINSQIFLKIISLIDVTSLDIVNNGERIEKFVKNIMGLIEKHDLPDVASICVPPSFIENVGVSLGSNSTISITSVAGGFPTSQTYIEVKMLECAMAIENGADEIDVVINVGDIIYGSSELAMSELELLRQEIDSDIIFKVIIESGELKTEDNIAKATRVAIEAGANFVKTSTGKSTISATPQAVITMCCVIKEHYERTGDMVGIKISGGISNVEDAALYYTIVEYILGEEWLNSKYFRIGSSSLLEKLIKVI